MQISVNKIENKVTFKIQNGYSFEILTPEKVKLLGSTENKLPQEKRDENVWHLKITEVALVHCNIVNDGCQEGSKVL